MEPHITSFGVTSGKMSLVMSVQEHGLDCCKFFTMFGLLKMFLLLNMMAILLTRAIIQLLDKHLPILPNLVGD
jgi:hypothetical protein